MYINRIYMNDNDFVFSLVYNPHNYSKILIKLNYVHKIICNELCVFNVLWLCLNRSYVLYLGKTESVKLFVLSNVVKCVFCCSVVTYFTKYNLFNVICPPKLFYSFNLTWCRHDSSRKRLRPIGSDM